MWSLSQQESWPPRSSSSSFNYGTPVCEARGFTQPLGTKENTWESFLVPFYSEIFVSLNCFAFKERSIFNMVRFRSSRCGIRPLTSAEAARFSKHSGMAVGRAVNSAARLERACVHILSTRWPHMLALPRPVWKEVQGGGSGTVRI